MPEICEDNSCAVDPFDGDLKPQCVINLSEIEHKKAENIVYSILGALVIIVSIALYRIDGDLLSCEPYYIKAEIQKMKQKRERGERQES